MPFRFLCLAITVTTTLLLGCSSETDSTDETAPPSVVVENGPDSPATSATAASVTVSQSSQDDTATAAADEQTPAEETTDTTTDDSIAETPPEDAVPAKLETTDDYAVAIEKRLANAQSGEDLQAAIALAEEGLAKVGEDSRLTNMLAYAIFESLNDESDAEVVQQRRLRLGELAREMAEDPAMARNAQVLFIEEAKGHLSAQDVEKAVSSLRESRDLGFSQVEYLLADPTFEPAAEEIKVLLREVVASEFSESEPFDFDFTLTSFEGQEVSLSDFRGKPVIVDFWGTWCPPCRAAIPHLVEVAEEYQDQIAVVGINVENPGGELSFDEAKAKLDAFTADQPINYPCLHGNQEVVAAVPEFEGFPTMLFIDAEGNVALKLVGVHLKEKLAAIVDEMLAGPGDDA